MLGGYARVSDFGPGVRASGGIAGVGGTIVIPLAHSYGLKLSGMAGTWDGDGLFSGAAHLFWRDPAIGLLGFYASYTRSETFTGTSVGRAALEFQRYLGQFTIDGQIGWEGIDLKSRPYTRLDLAYYLNDNWKAKIGYRYTDDRHLAAFGTEAVLQTVNGNALTGFIEGRVGHDYGAVLAGLRMYFGSPNKSLIRRHREDDPGEQTEGVVDDLAKPRVIPAATPESPCPPGEVFDPEFGCVFEVT